MKKFTQTFVVAITILAPFVGSPSAAQVCGDVIVTPTVLSADLTCSTPTALSIGVGGSLDLNGYTVACDSNANTGIFVGGKGASVINGVVTGCSSNIRLAGSGGHTVSHIVSSNSASDGIYAEATARGNRLIENSVRGAGGDCILLDGGKDTLTRNVAENCSGSGIVTDGQGPSKLTDNVVSSAGGTGIIAAVAGSSLTRNVVDGRGITLTGIAVGADAKVTGNTAVGVTGTGFVLASGSKAQENRAAGNGQNGFELTGPAKLSKNRAVGNGAAGFVKGAGDDVQMTKNHAGANGTFGISIAAGAGHSITKNAAIGNGTGIQFGGSASEISDNSVIGNSATDVQDLTVGCGTNTWSGNTFGSNTQGCEQ